MQPANCNLTELGTKLASAPAVLPRKIRAGLLPKPRKSLNSSFMGSIPAYSRNLMALAGDYPTY